MRRRRLVVPGFALLIALAAALWSAPVGLALPANLGQYLFGAKLVRAELVVKDGGEVHDYRVDRGKVLRLAPASLTLLEKDGSLQTLAVAAGTLVDIRRGMTVTTVRDGSAPAETVLTGPAVPLGTVLLGPKLARGEVVAKEAGTLRDYRLDRGKIRGIAPGSLTLFERDGTLQTIPVAATARVTLNGGAKPFARLRLGRTAITIRDGTAPAFEVRATR